jgi:hypothetical protein
MMARKIALSLAMTILVCAAGSAAEPARPDFTGIWTSYIVPGPRPAGGGGGGFGGPRASLPYTPEGKNRVAEYQKLVGPERANPAAYCVDYGMPSMMENAGGYPIEFIQKPDQLTIIYEVEGEMRRVFMGRSPIPPEKRIATRQGYSVGHWEGSTLVVETTDLEDGIDQGQHPHSEDAKILEHFSLSTDDKGTKVLSYDMTLTDPAFYTEPVKAQKKWMPLANGYIITYRCPDEFWLALLDARREQLKAGKPVDARMSDIYKAREAKE